MENFKSISTVRHKTDKTKYPKELWLTIKSQTLDMLKRPHNFEGILSDSGQTKKKTKEKMEQRVIQATCIVTKNPNKKVQPMMNKTWKESNLLKHLEVLLSTWKNSKRKH